MKKDNAGMKQIEKFESGFLKRFAELKELILSTAGELINKKIAIEVTCLPERKPKDLMATQEFPLVCLLFRSGSTKRTIDNILIFSPDTVKNIYAWIVNEAPDEKLKEEHLDGIREAAQQILSKIKISVPDDAGTFTTANFNAFKAQSYEEIEKMISDQEGLCAVYNVNFDDTSYAITHFIWPRYLNQNEQEQIEVNKMQDMNDMLSPNPVDVQPAEFGAFATQDGDLEMPRNVDMLMDVELDVTVELGKKTMLISDILKIGKGSIVELEKAAGEPLDIFVNGRKLAEGEVVVVDDHFGIRITQLASPKERLKSLG